MTINSLLILVVSLVCSVIGGRLWIPFLRGLKFGQTVREDGPQSHIAKNGTPTIGGVIFITSIVLSSLLFFDKNLEFFYPIISLVLFATVGFMDDYLKVKRGKNLGLTAKQKMILLFIVALVLSVLAKNLFGTKIWVPFIDSGVELGILYVPFMMLVYIGASNAVNLTDGLDGLATSVTIVVLCFIGIIGYIMNSLGVTPVAVVSIGALLGFLLFNMNPASVFMGDTGSLGLGGLVVALSAQMGMPLILLLIGVMYVIETLSVIIQVISFKLTGKRVFRMSPIHHHFEIGGLSENKIVILFSVISIVFGTIAIAII